MLLNIISGGIGSGKSSYLYSLIKENLKNNPGSDAVVIVPEQFSYTAEKTLSEAMGGLGLNRVEVLTFSRLVHRYVNSENNVLPSGKTMLLCKAASKIGEDNMFFTGAKRNGFITSLSDLFSEFKRYQITPDDLEGTQIEGASTSKKLHSVNEIYKNYLSYFDESFTDSDDALDIFARLIASSDIFKNTFFFIDDYNDFMPQHYDVIRALITASRGVFVTLCIGKNDEDGLFAPVIKAKSRLSAIALSENAQLYTKELKNDAEYIKADDIRHLLKNWENRVQYAGSCENILVFTARDLYSEIEHTASEIISLVRDGGCRFRDIGVILGDMQQYIHILNAVFSDYNIPFFTDEKLAITMHPIVRTVLSLFNITAENWSYSSVFDYLRAGYIYTKNEHGVFPLNQEEIDILENYILATGIKGKKAWFEQWTENGETIFDDVIESYAQCEYDLEKLNCLREQIIRPFKNFLENKGRTVQAIATAVYNFLCDINLYEGIIAECSAFDKSGLRDESEQFKQIWNFILEVLDQMVTTMGGEVISRENFASYMKNGLSECSLSIIPSGLDRVSVGTVSRNSPARVKHLFIVGAVHGAIPAEPSCSAIFSPLDRSLINAALAKSEKELAPDDLNRMMLENLKLYRIISTATEKLFISYPAANSEGSSLSCASFVNDILKMFPNIKKTDNVISKPTNEELLASSKRGFYYMLSRLSEYYREKPEKLWQAVFDWYAQNPEYKDKLEILKTAAKYKRIQPKLSRMKAELLYGKDKRYSITALEKFSQCPFAYYLEKGLYAQPQEIKRVEKSHIGSVIHAAICEFCKKVEEGASTIPEIHDRWRELTPQDCDELILTVMNEMSEKILARTGSDRRRIEYLLSRCERTLKKSVETIRLSLSKGGYTAVCYEKDFEVSINWKENSVTLFGTIDRIDIMEHLAEKKAGIRIIDYKSGKKKFSVSAIVNKIDMQLVLYAVAAVKLYKSGELEKTNSALSPQVSAIMYNKINDDIISLDLKDKSSAPDKLKKKKKLDGIVILDEVTSPSGDDEFVYDTAFDMDKDLEATSQSEFLNIAFKQDSTLTAASQVTSRKTFDLLADYMQKSVIEADKAIKSGDISIAPYKSGQKSSCSYCDFREVCMFDTAFDSCRKIFSDDDKAIEFIKKELKD